MGEGCTRRWAGHHTPMPRALLAIAVVLTLAPVAAAHPVDDYIRGVMAARKIPGVSIVIPPQRQGGEGRGLRDGEPRARRAGTAGHDLPVRLWGSVHGGGLLLLAEDGKLTLDDPLAKHFPEGPATWHRITIRHLLDAHIRPEGLRTGRARLPRDYTEADLLMIVAPCRSSSSRAPSGATRTPAISSSACSPRARRQALERFQAERIFTPLGMKTTRDHHGARHRPEPLSRLDSTRRAR